MKLLFPLLAVLLAACAGTYHWRNANVPPEQWGTDLAACQRQATREVEKDTARDHVFFGDPNLGSPNTLQANLASYDSARHHKAILAYCMKTRGYIKAKGSNPK